MTIRIGLLPQVAAAHFVSHLHIMVLAGWDRDWHNHIHPVAEIEWIELRAVSLDWLLSTLRKYNLPFSLEEGTPCVWGYTRPGTQPLWD